MDNIKVIDANKLQEYKCHIMAYIHECEVRKVEQVHGEFTTEAGKKQEYNYILLQCDDVDGERIYLKDKDMGNLSRYKRGQIGTFKIRIDVGTGYGGKTSMLVADFDGFEDEPKKSARKSKT